MVGKMKKQRQQRQNRIIELIEQYEISTQDALKQYLEADGIAVTQATLSRDINELNLKKQLSGSGVYIYVRSKKADLQCPQIFRDSVVAVDYALNTVVIKCSTGMAQAVCAILDKMGWDGIVGTIAGDDTIFVLMKTETAAEEFMEELSSNLK